MILVPKLAVPSLLLFIVGTLAAASPQDSAQTAEVQSILREASALVPEIDVGQRPSAAANIASLQTRSGDLEGALKTLWLVTGQPSGTLPIDSVASVLIDEGRLQMALPLIDMLCAPTEKPQAYAQVAAQLATKGDFDDALQTVRSMRSWHENSALVVNTLMRIYVEQHRKADASGAATTLGKALAAVQSANGDTQTISSLYEDVVNYLSQAGDKESARPLIEKIALLGEQEKNPDKRQDLLRSLASAQSSIGDYSAAERTMDRMTLGIRRDEANQLFIFRRIQSGDEAGILRQIGELPNEVQRLSALRQLADAQAAAGNYGGALSIVDSISGGGNRAYALAQLALEQAEKGDPAAAHTVQLCWETAQSTKSETASYVFEYIAVTYGLLGDYTTATALVNDMDDASRVWPLWNLTELMVEHSRKDAALELAHRQYGPHPRAYALLGVAEGLLKTETKRKADSAGGAPQ